MKTYQTEIKCVTHLVKASSKKDARIKFQENAKIKIKISDIYLYPYKIKQM